MELLVYTLFPHFSAAFYLGVLGDVLVIYLLFRLFDIIFKKCMPTIDKNVVNAIAFVFVGIVGSVYLVGQVNQYYDYGIGKEWNFTAALWFAIALVTFLMRVADWGLRFKKS